MAPNTEIARKSHLWVDTNYQMEERMEVVMNNLPLVCALVGVIGVLFSIILAAVVKSAPAGDEKMQGIANAVKEGAIAFVFTGVYERTTGKYGDRGIRYVHIEVGHAAQNLCLQATAMGLGAVTVGAFYDEEVTKLLNLPEKERPLYIIPVGRK